MSLNHVVGSSDLSSVQAPLDVLSSHVAVLDADGVIVAVNKAWRDFSAGNGGRGDYMGVNYLEVCARAAEAGSSEAARAHAGLKRVLIGASDDYGLAYECSERIFRLRSKAILSDNGRQALVSHEDITDLVNAQRALRLARSDRLRLAEELGQRLAAIGLAMQVLKKGGPTEKAISTIELALGEARRELKRLRQGPGGSDLDD